MLSDIVLSTAAATMDAVADKLIGEAVAGISDQDVGVLIEALDDPCLRGFDSGDYVRRHDRSRRFIAFEQLDGEPPWVEATGGGGIGDGG